MGIGGQERIVENGQLRAGLGQPCGQRQTRGEGHLLGLPAGEFVEPGIGAGDQETGRRPRIVDANRMGRRPGDAPPVAGGKLRNPVRKRGRHCALRNRQRLLQQLQRLRPAALALQFFGANSQPFLGLRQPRIEVLILQHGEFAIQARGGLAISVERGLHRIGRLLHRHRIGHAGVFHSRKPSAGRRQPGGGIGALQFQFVQRPGRFLLNQPRIHLGQLRLYVRHRRARQRRARGQRRQVELRLQRLQFLPAIAVTRADGVYIGRIGHPGQTAAGQFVQLPTASRQRA